MSMVFEDRISTYPNRYAMTDENGNVSHVILERADEPTIPGTPLNAETFNAAFGEKAPAGYGLGEANGKYCADCNTALRPGFYYISDGNCANTPAGYDRWKWAVMLVQRRGYDVFQTIMFGGVSATRMITLDENTGVVKTAGVWAYITPPLNAGEEYLTTEKFNGNSVYAKLINFGTVTAGGKAVDITTDTIDSLVRVEGCWVNGDIKELFTSDYIVTGVSVDRYDGASRLKVETNTVAASYTGYPVVYYTKS